MALESRGEFTQIHTFTQEETPSADYLQSIVIETKDGAMV